MADPQGLRMQGYAQGAGMKQSFVRAGHLHSQSRPFLRSLQNLSGVHIQHPSFGGHGHMGGRRAAHRHAAGTKHAGMPHHVGSHRHAGHHGHAVHSGKGTAARGGWGWQHGRHHHTGGRRRNA